MLWGLCKVTPIQVSELSALLRNLQSIGSPHWQLQLSLAGCQLQAQLCMESEVLLVALADTLQKNTLSPWRFMYTGKRECLYPSRHTQCRQGGTQRGDRAWAYPPRQQLSRPGFPLIALKFLPSRSTLAFGS